MLLFLHIAAASIWLGGAVLFFVLFQPAKTAQDPVLAERLGAHTASLAQRLFMATVAVLVLAFS